MTIHLPDDLANSIRAAVVRGHFGREQDVVEAAVRYYLTRMDAAYPQSATQGTDELSPQEVQRRLYEAGVISEIKPPITDLTPYQNRRAIPIEGEPISETVIRERR